MQSTNQPAKFLVPFAQNDSAKVEIPATSSDPTRFSQSLGSPPLTGMPPEAGGVPPQLEDFNGAINQVARGVWWALGGGRFAYDSAWANDSLIGGYARGAVLPAALGAGTIGMGEWYNNAEANTVDPDAVGTGWVPGYHYGALALTGQAGGTVTLTPAQAAKRVITIAGTLTSNLVLVVPGWIYAWTVFNSTGGNFTVTVKNAATPGVDIPQNGAPTPLWCDGSSVSLLAPNIAPATSGTQALQRQQKGALCATTSGSFVVPVGVVQVVVDAVAPGGGGGGSGAGATGGSGAVGGGGGGGGAGGALVRVPYAVTPGSTISWTIGNPGNGAPQTPSGNGASGGNGGNLVISGPGFNGGTTVTLTGGTGGGGGTSAPTVGVGAAGGPGAPNGAPGSDTVSISASLGAGGGGGNGASSPFGGGGSGGRGAAGTGVTGAPAGGFGAGGGGAGGTYLQGSGVGGAGGAGSGGLIAIQW